MGAEPRPFVCDVKTGYLLQCSFMSPRPYCWTNANTVKVSGWDVDKSGGHFAFQPTGKLPNGFAFHSDWFKLVDTSDKAAITMTHQIARQSEGPITLEFRFKLPAPMDGACWQLRDLKQAGVSLAMSKGRLCLEKAGAEPAVLAPVEAGRDYGVKVVADITTKKADVFVDGEAVIRAAAFAHPIETIDCFLVKTGDAATGEMFLGPVNIFKGYAVNETFVTCGVGKAPADWKVAGGDVRQFECGTKPDIFSLKVNGEASKTFAPIRGKVVFECRVLLPEKQDDMRIALAGGGATALSLALPAEHRTNFWYMAKVIADPASQTADVFINGKLTGKGIAFPGKVQAFDRVGFMGRFWLDDVRVYAWQDYPANYVPEPKPVPSKGGLLVGVESCNLWREGTAYAGWDYIHPHAARLKPHLGWYDEGNPEETDWEIKWQVEHGIGFEMHCWYRPNNAVNHPIKDGVLDQGIIKGLFNARYGHLKKFAIMYTNDGAGETNPQDWRENVIPYWIEYFFKDPRYLKIDGKPVLSIYHLGNMQRMFGGVEGCRKAVETLRETCRAAGLPGVIVLTAEHHGGNFNKPETMRAIGVECCYAYTWETPDPSAQRKENVARRDAVAGAGINMLPSISTGWDRTAWGVGGGGFMPVDDYKALAVPPKNPIWLFG
ncbi:MAG: glycoside hydrolase family 99-like domain-containing protein [Planctomycetota bacterium]|nr:glycoside hydrolase family 99-like domain-containing protein [Planctomycetota bacterium]